MTILFDQFYKRFGATNLNHLLSRIYTLDQFHFPRNSLYHHVSHDTNDLFPDQNLPYFKGYKARLPIDHVLNTVSLLGNPHRITKHVNSVVLVFQQQHKLFKRFIDCYRTVKNPTLLEIINYGLLQITYQYPQSKLTDYQKWYNIENTFWNKIKQISEETDRIHYRFVKVPDILPSVTLLNFFSRPTPIHNVTKEDLTKEFRRLNNVSLESARSKFESFLDLMDKIRDDGNYYKLSTSLEDIVTLNKLFNVSLEDIVEDLDITYTKGISLEQVVNSSLVRIFNTPEKLFILEIWKWLGDNRNDSFISVLDQTELLKTNLVFLIDNKWSILNLGYLNNWRKTKDKQAVNKHISGVVLEPHQLQKAFLRHMLQFQLMRGSDQTTIDLIEDNVVTKNNILESGIDNSVNVKSDNSILTPKTISKDIIDDKITNQKNINSPLILTPSKDNSIGMKIIQL